MPYDDEEFDDEFEDEEGSEDETITFVCEDCDYRWKSAVQMEDDEYVSDELICPMCGSSNVSDF